MRLTDYTNGRIASGQILFRDGAGQEIDLARASEGACARFAATTSP